MPQTSKTKYLTVVIGGIGLAIVNFAAWAIGPSFDCSQARTPGQQLVCADTELSRKDLAYAQAYYVLRQQVGEAGWRSLKLATIASENQSLQLCGIPSSGQLPPSPNTSAMARCLAQAYERQRTQWIGGMTGPAADEASRPVDEHLALQGRLRALGFLPTDAVIDGVYGTITRDAIAVWQRSKGRSDTGFISNSDATILMNASPPDLTNLQTTTFSAPGRMPSPPAVTEGNLSSILMDARPPVPTTPQAARFGGSTVITSPPIATVATLYSLNKEALAVKSPGDSKDTFGIVILLVAGVAIMIYFLPAIIGSRRQIASSGALFFVNLFLGWTVLGWLFCILWAATGATKGQDAFFRNRVASSNLATTDPMNDPAFRKAYAEERARLDHEAAQRSS